MLSLVSTSTHMPSFRQVLKGFRDKFRFHRGLSADCTDFRRLDGKVFMFIILYCKRERSSLSKCKTHIPSVNIRLKPGFIEKDNYQNELFFLNSTPWHHPTGYFPVTHT